MKRMMLVAALVGMAVLGFRAQEAQPHEPCVAPEAGAVGYWLGTAVEEDAQGWLVTWEPVGPGGDWVYVVFRRVGDAWAPVGLTSKARFLDRAPVLDGPKYRVFAIRK